MTRRPKPKKDAKGKFLPNKARAKAGLNRQILDKNWHKLEVYTQYKAHQAGKAFFKVAPNHTSQECAHCHHIHPDNRRSQARFPCRSCGHTDNADFNAAKVIRWRAIQYITNAGTELSSRGATLPCRHGTWSRRKTTGSPRATWCRGVEASKKKAATAAGSASALAGSSSRIGRIACVYSCIR